MRWAPLLVVLLACAPQPPPTPLQPEIEALCGELCALKTECEATADASCVDVCVASLASCSAVELAEIDGCAELLCDRPAAAACFAEIDCLATGVPVTP